MSPCRSLAPWPETASTNWLDIPFRVCICHPYQHHHYCPCVTPNLQTGWSLYYLFTPTVWWCMVMSKPILFGLWLSSSQTPFLLVLWTPPKKHSPCFPWDSPRCGDHKAAVRLARKRSIFLEASVLREWYVFPICKHLIYVSGNLNNHFFFKWMFGETSTFSFEELESSHWNNHQVPGTRFNHLDCRTFHNVGKPSRSCNINNIKE